MIGFMCATWCGIPTVHDDATYACVLIHALQHACMSVDKCDTEILQLTSLIKIYLLLHVKHNLKDISNLTHNLNS